MKANTTINTDGITHLRKENYGSAFAAEMRAELKRRGVKGVSVRSNRSTYTDSLTITVKMAAEDYATVTEAASRHNMDRFLRDWDSSGVYFGNRWHERHELECLTWEEKKAAYEKYLAGAIVRAAEFNGHRYNDRDYHWEFSQRGYERLAAIYRIASQWNWDNSDGQTDYFDVGYYLHISLQAPAGFEAAAN